MNVKPIKEVMFNYGDILKTIEEQANKQGYTLGDRAQSLEDSKNNWIFLGARERESMIKRLNKAVMRSLKPLKTEV